MDLEPRLLRYFIAVAQGAISAAPPSACISRSRR